MDLHETRGESSSGVALGRPPILRVIGHTKLIPTSWEDTIGLSRIVAIRLRTCSLRQSFERISKKCCE